MPPDTHSHPERRPTLAICGNGASAVALLQALAKGSVPFTVFVIGTGAPGEGLAYATQNPAHLLNTPSGRMSINPGEPDDFMNWLKTRDLWSEDWEGQFARRYLYGRYLREAADKAASCTHLNVTFLREKAISLTRNHSTWLVAHGAGKIHADFVVLATGNDMPSPLAPRLESHLRHRITDNPWELPPIADDEQILILGTGLTAVDTVLGLSQGSRRGGIFLVSRHGLLPHGHVIPRPAPVLNRPFARTALGLLQELRGAARTGQWQDMMDAMRPHWSAIWHGLPVAEKLRFLRHAATIWNMHRHRLAPQAARELQRFLKGRNAVLKGRVVAIIPQGRAVRVTVRSRHEETCLVVDRIINCMGPNSDPQKTHNPLIENIVASRQARTSPCGVGLDVAADNRVIDHDGRPHSAMFAMGALTRGQWWEITAMPEIVDQAQQIAENLCAARIAQNASPPGVMAFPENARKTAAASISRSG